MVDINMDKFYRPTKRWIETILEDEGYLNSLFIVGEGGLGKTYNTLDVLKKRNIEYVYVNNYSSVVELYNFLFENKDKVIVFDDFETIWQLGTKGINIFKGAFWGLGKSNKRIVTYKSTSKLVRAPSQFEFEGKMIFLLNKFPSNQDSMLRALLSRTSVVYLNFGLEETLEIMNEFVKLPYRELTYEQRLEVFRFIETYSVGIRDNINFRTLIKMYDIYINNPDCWEEMCCQVFQQDDRLVLLKRVLRDNANVADAEREFCDEVGCGRATFYRLKRRLE